MKDFQLMFRDVIDRTNGTVVLDEKKFTEIQIDTLQSCLRLCEMDHLKTSTDVADSIRYYLWKLENGKK